MDRKELKLKKTNSSGIRGELYKGDDWGSGLVTFYTDNTPPFDDQSLIWDGFEIKYPDDLPVDWSLLSDFAHFVNNSTDTAFGENIFDKFQKENAMNYFIFLNMIDAADNTGKNIFLAKYDAGEPYFYAPWDLDGTVGYTWTGDRSNSWHQILSNHLFERLMTVDPSDYNADISAKWFSLRDSTLSLQSLDNRLDSIYNFLRDAGVYEREHIAWPDYQMDTAELAYTKQWISDRLVVLDTFFAHGPSSVYEPNPDPSNNLVISYDNRDFVIHLSGSLSYQSLDYQLFSADGKRLATGMINADFNRINASSLSNSVYFIRFYDQKHRQTFTKKVVKYSY